ncbi:RNA-guided endonuclease InsQ/TnpB family protein [Leisingera caerulea]|uniref:RNA-guided endonuclease InsQ/TnpB family protein n=1 Tax=Leisingera caerulea TaxID=506591 RepID=UPI00068523A1|nr:RNA-guided endonuclease TnpB family protein [Leisingera caerulea]
MYQLISAMPRSAAAPAGAGRSRSRRYAAARARLAKLKGKQARIRAHAAHVLSRDLAGRFGLVAIEDLKIRSMTRSARGTREAPGRNVAQKSGLNRSILGIGWHALERMLGYKLEETGGVLVKVPAAYTSQTCAACGHVDARSRESQALFACTACGSEANADTNAARNILDRALNPDRYRRGNTPLLDVEASALAACEASTRLKRQQLDAAAV